MYVLERKEAIGNLDMATSRLLCVRIEACADEVDLQVDLRWT